MTRAAHAPGWYGPCSRHGCCLHLRCPDNNSCVRSVHCHKICRDTLASSGRACRITWTGAAARIVYNVCTFAARGSAVAAAAARWLLEAVTLLVGLTAPLDEAEPPAGSDSGTVDKLFMSNNRLPQVSKTPWLGQPGRCCSVPLSAALSASRDDVVSSPAPSNAPAPAAGMGLPKPPPA